MNVRAAVAVVQVAAAVVLEDAERAAQEDARETVPLGAMAHADPVVHTNAPAAVKMAAPDAQ